MKTIDIETDKVYDYFWFFEPAIDYYTNEKWEPMAFNPYSGDIDWGDPHDEKNIIQF